MLRRARTALRADYAKWLGEQAAEPKKPFALLKPFLAKFVQIYNVELGVNNMRNDGEELLQPA